MALSPTQIICILTSLVHLPSPISSQCTNQYEHDTGPHGEDIWRSAPSQCFTPVQSISYGTIRVGKEMSMKFDFTWNGYTFNPRGEPYNDYENFFRVGCSAHNDNDPNSPCSGGNGCEGLGARFPSFWVTPPLTPTGGDNGFPRMHLSISSAGDCQPPMELTSWGQLFVGVKLHIEIFWNETQVIVGIGHYSNFTQDPSTFPERTMEFMRTAGTDSKFLGWLGGSSIFGHQALGYQNERASDCWGYIF